MRGIDYVKRWVGKDFDDDAVRRRFIRHLMSWHNEFTTPYWKSDFNDWLIYEGTIKPCGLRVESITEDFVTLLANCAGVQTDGICLDATFKVPTTDFTVSELVTMIGPFRYHRNGPAVRFTWYPRIRDGRIKPCYITELVWWYDGFYNEGDEE